MNELCISRHRCLVLVLVLGVAATLTTTRGFAADDLVDFNRDIRPLFSNICYECHGPDAKQRKTEWRLDTKEGAFSELDSGEKAIVPGHSGESELYRKISAADADERMPPADFAKQLKPAQVELIKRWIDQGGKWRGHWAFEKPIRPQPTAVKKVAAVQNPIDQFVLARLEKEGLAPSPETDKTNLIRRVTFDLTGLPPTLAEVDAFLADKSPRAYETLVDQLLKSPRYGEHMARFWLDVARYGDTHGLHLDNERSLWPYRDWVISAFNNNMPFDQFTVEQLAGDLLPDPTLQQLIATGFNRCNVTTSEGGSIREEYRVRYATDRVETLSTVWMGLTLNCTVCHDHKFGPFTQKEFYQLFAYYNNIDEDPMDGNKLLPPPVIKVPTPKQSAQLAALNKKITAKKAVLAGSLPEVDLAQTAWETEWSSQLRDQWQILDPQQFTSSGGATLRKLDDASVLAEGENPAKDVYEVVSKTNQTGITAIRLEALTHESLKDNGPGRAGNSNYVLSEFEVEAISVTDPTQVKKIKFQSARADYSQTNGDYLIAKTIDGVVDDKNGWAVDGNVRHEDRTAFFIASEQFGFAGGTLLKVRLRHETGFGQHAIGRFRLAVSTDGSVLSATPGDWQMVGPFQADNGSYAYKTAFPPEEGVDLKASYEEGKLKWQAKPDFVDGKVHRLKGYNCATYLYRTISSPSPRKATFSIGSNDSVKAWLNGRQILANDVQRAAKPDQEKVTVALQAGENHLLLKIVNYSAKYEFYFQPTIDNGGSEALQLSPILAKTIEQRSADEKQRLRDYFRRNHSPQWRALDGELTALQKQVTDLDAVIPSTMVMKEKKEPRDCFVLIRGEYTKPDEKVEMGVPASLPPLAADAPKNRLGLARWLVAPEHPLTARVTVNRFWQQYFGTGIVKTSEDFGSQGEWPSHHELIDWLATEFVQSGWDVKHLQKLIVMSATYRQSSHVTPQFLERDPENRLLARGPRFRLDAEMLRDNALALSGLLVEKIGGRSVKPYQPDGLWKAVGYSGSNTVKFMRDSGEKLYRRSLYTFWKRTSPPSSMSTFDAPSRESCTVRRARTNTPLQALLLLNDEQYVEAARSLAQRMITEGGATPEQRIEFAFRLATARLPNDFERSVLIKLYGVHLAEYQADPAAAAKLLAVGESPRNEKLNPSEHAAWTMIANVILNLSETITKG